MFRPDDQEGRDIQKLHTGVKGAVKGSEGSAMRYLIEIETDRDKVKAVREYKDDRKDLRKRTATEIWQLCLGVMNLPSGIREILFGYSDPRQVLYEYKDRIDDALDIMHSYVMNTNKSETAYTLEDKIFKELANAGYVIYKEDFLNFLNGLERADFDD